ncbi:nucleoside-diphosphate sugar epimerase/dehydratase [Sphingomonas melonis]|uniref:nucleoside-diphosphate sugar epimerase/dehydratase n=1 Tax=Sphingomonas melonis TaxID=152682 RepID=UPI0006859DE8|nr:nucleoside-diphosphate sugar epimerase/dehydratase [Sphingomonas melonis]
MNKIWKRAEPAVVSALHYLVESGQKVKISLVVANDAILCLLAVWIAFSLRLGGWIISSPAFAAIAIVSIVAWLPIFLFSGVYRSVVRYMGSRTMIGIATSCMMIGVVLAIFTLLNVVPGIPRTIAAIQPMVFAVLLIFSRLVARYILFDLLNQRNFTGQRHRVLIYGAGSSGRQLALSLRHEGNMILRGYLDDDLRVAGKHLDGVRVYRTDNVADLIDRLGIDMVLLAVPRVSRQQREQMVRKFEDISVRVLTLPAIGNLLDGSVSVGDLREIEITDLLGRDPVPPNQHLLHRTVTGRSVMITGAGGSIGSELCRQISRLEPLAIILVEMTEHALYSIEAELREAENQGLFASGFAIHAELGSIADIDTARRLFDRWHPETVFHAAAYKHVPLVEENVIAGLRNNIIGTLNCAVQADRVGVRNFILVSTDKAVRPTNVMGASKRICELVLQALSGRGSQTLFAIVRFGNVLGSSGSVVPRFQRQIRQGGPVTLTHRDVTRYFMTIPEAAQLVIQAGAMAEGGEVYVLDMGEPIRIYDLARTMINLSGLSVRDATHPEGDIEICEIGLRKGEKLYEELLIGNSPRPTDHARIMQAREDHLDWPVLAEHLATLQEALTNGNRQQAVEVMCTLVPEYSGTHAH